MRRGWKVVIHHISLPLVACWAEFPSEERAQTFADRWHPMDDWRVQVTKAASPEEYVEREVN